MYYYFYYYYYDYDYDYDDDYYYAKLNKNIKPELKGSTISSSTCAA